MAFTWKDKENMWKGEGIYFLTFTVKNRARLLGTLRRLPTYTAPAATAATAPSATAAAAPAATAAAAPSATAAVPMAAAPPPPHIAAVDGTDLGNAVYRIFNGLQSRYKGFHVIAKQIMPNHFHAVCWCKEDFGNESIKMVARSFSQACSKEARRLYQRQLAEHTQQLARLNRADTNGATLTTTAAAAAAAATLATAAAAAATATDPAATAATTAAAAATLATTAAAAPAATAATTTAAAAPAAATATAPAATAAAATLATTATAAPATTAAAPAATTAAAALADVLPSIPAQLDCANPYDCGNGASTLFETPFIRTLAHAGQLRSMIDYTHSNPDNLQRITDNPDLYTIHRHQTIAGLLFDTMGKTRILDYPDRHVVALSRSLTPEHIDAEVRKTLRLAESGTVIYSAAINTAEKAVTKAIREAGYPLVVLMLEGFPPEGTEAARFFHPGGAYHQACGEGRLVILAPHPVCYTLPTIIDYTERELAHKAAQKGYRYHPIPHSSTRWRMIAGNIILRAIAEEL